LHLWLTGCTMGAGCEGRGGGWAGIRSRFCPITMSCSSALVPLRRLVSLWLVSSVAHGGGSCWWEARPESVRPHL
jgi:hypothetical protein